MPQEKVEQRCDKTNGRALPQAARLSRACHPLKRGLPANVTAPSTGQLHFVWGSPHPMLSVHNKTLKLLIRKAKTKFSHIKEQMKVQFFSRVGHTQESNLLSGWIFKANEEWDKPIGLGPSQSFALLTGQMENPVTVDTLFLNSRNPNSIL